MGVSVSLSTMRNVALALIAFVACGVAQQIQLKDQAELDLFNSIAKEKDPNNLLKLLDQWSKGYPDSVLAARREQAYLTVYQQLQRPREAFDTASAILKKTPDHYLALSTVLAYVPYLNQAKPTAADLDAAEKASSYVLANLDAILGADKKPAELSADQWNNLKPTLRNLAQKTMGFIYVTRKDNERAETELTKALQVN